MLLNVILGALFRPLLPSSSASEATTTSNQDAVNLDCDVTSSLYKISDKENGNLSLHNSFTNGNCPNEVSISCNGSFIASENSAQKSPVIIIFFKNYFHKNVQYLIVLLTEQAFISLIF